MAWTEADLARFLAQQQGNASVMARWRAQERQEATLAPRQGKGRGQAGQRKRDASVSLETAHTEIAETAKHCNAYEVTISPLWTVTETNGYKEGSRYASRHRIKRQKQTVHEMLCYTLGAFPPVVCERWTILLTRIAPRRLDSDNLQSALKHVRDAVATWLGIDDGSDRLTWEYSQERGVPHQYAVRMVMIPEERVCP